MVVEDLNLPLSDSEDESANVSVVEAADASLSHSLVNVTYVGEMYYDDISRPLATFVRCDLHQQLQGHNPRPDTRRGIPRPPARLSLGRPLC